MLFSTFRLLLFLLPLILIPPIESIAGPPAFSDPDSLFRSAVQLQRAGKNGEAKQVLRSLLNEYPRYSDARTLYAGILSWESNFPAALAEYDSVLMLQPDNENALFGKAQVLAWMGRFELSTALLRTLVLENPRSKGYHSELAKVRFWAHDYPVAFEEFKKAYALDSTSVEVIRGAARSSVLLQGPDEGIRWYNRLLRLIPSDVEARAEVNRLSYYSVFEFQVQCSDETFPQSSLEDHRTFAGEMYYEVSSGWRPYAHISQLSRFSKNEFRFGGGLYANPWYETALFAQLLVSPSATVIPKADFTFEASTAVAGGLELSAGYRLLSFDSSNVNLFIPSFTFYLNEQWWMMPKVYLGRSSSGFSSTTFMATLFYRPTTSMLLRIMGFSGDESFRATTINEIALNRSQGVFLAGKFRVSAGLAVEGSYLYTSRRPSGDSHLFGVGISTFF